jgi:hypothetical protein
MPLPREHLIDELATAYIQAIAAAAGSTIAVSRRDFGVDGTLKHIVKEGARFIESGFPVDFQLKGTSVANLDSDPVKYDLSVRNYDLIVTRSPAATPYYLFLVCFRSEANGWVAQESERLIMNASAFLVDAIGRSRAKCDIRTHRDTPRQFPGFGRDRAYADGFSREVRK